MRRTVTLARGVYPVARELLADGATNGEIAERVGITEDTVKSHVKSLLQVSDCRTRTEFVARVLHGRIRVRPGTHTAVVVAEEAEEVA